MTEARTLPPLRVKITDDCAGQRVDVALAKLRPGYSRRLFKALGLAGDLRSEGRRVRPSDRVMAGQEIEVRLPTHRDEPTADPPRIVRCTPELLYVAKPAGMHTCGRWPAQPGTVAQWVRNEHPECADASPDPREAGAVHRLDRVTSGLVVFARHRRAWTEARSYFDNQSVRKIYLAASLGPPFATARPQLEQPEATSLNSLLSDFRNEVQSGWLTAQPDWRPEHAMKKATIELTAALSSSEQTGRVRVHSNGRAAHSSVITLAQRPCELNLELTLFLVQIHSGVRHQIRAHLAHIDHPILGDSVYGSAVPHERAIALHAMQIAFPDTFDRAGAVTLDPPSQWLATWLSDQAHT